MPNTEATKLPLGKNTVQAMKVGTHEGRPIFDDRARVVFTERQVQEVQKTARQARGLKKRIAEVEMKD